MKCLTPREAARSVVGDSNCGGFIELEKVGLDSGAYIEGGK
jgi:hypothetical protein